MSLSRKFDSKIQPPRHDDAQEGDMEEAKRLLREYRARTRQADEQPSTRLSLRRGSSGDVFKYHEVNQVLAEVVDSNGSVGVVTALLTLGADVNFSSRKSGKVWNKILQRGQQEHRSDLLQRATSWCTAGTVDALAGSADQMSLDGALPQAISRADLDVLKALLDHGADVNYENGNALLMAVEASHVDLVSALISRAKVPVSPANLDAVAGKAYSTIAGRSDLCAGRDIIELCLSAGASGPETKRLLTLGFAEVVQRRQPNLLETMLRFAKPKGEHMTDAIIAALNSEQKEVLVRLLRLGPSNETLAMAASHLVGVKDETLRCELAQVLIRGGAQGEVLGDALLRTVQQLCELRETAHTEPAKDVVGKHLFNLFLNSGRADVDHDGGEALRTAVKASRSDLVQQIVSKRPSPDSLGASLPVAMKLNDDQQSLWIVELLLQHPISQEAVNTAILDTVKTGPSGIPFTELLLRQASGDIASIALIQVVEQFSDPNPDSRDLALDQTLDILFAAHADIDFEHGKSVEIAALRGDSHILRRLLGHSQDVTGNTATIALTNAIMARHDEPRLLELLDTIHEQSGTLDLDRPLGGMPPPIFLCLDLYGGSVDLVDRLVRMGCSLEIQTDFQSEAVTVLMWALLQPENKISDEVIKVIIEYGADVSYAAPETRITPLMLAANGRPNVVSWLLEAGAKVGAKDCSQRSALFYGSSAGDIDVVSCILEYKPAPNDGSLHEASRRFDPEIMTLLIAGGHDPDFRSEGHNGCTALGEMALNGLVPQDNVQAEKALEVLKEAGASPLVQIHGKSVIFLALDNTRDPVQVTRLLVDNLLYKTINSEENVFQRGEFHYSPTIYLSRGLATGPSHAVEELLKILENHGAKDRFYADIPHPQPFGAVGMPPDIEAFEKSRLERERRHLESEQEFRMNLRRQKEAAQHAWELRALDTNQAIQNAEVQHHAESSLALDGAEVQSKISWKHHKDRLAMLSDERNADINFAGEVHAQRYAQRALDHRQKLDFGQDRHVQGLQHGQDRHQQTIEHREAHGRVGLALQDATNAQQLQHQNASNASTLEWRGRAHAQRMVKMRDIHQQHVNQHLEREKLSLGSQSRANAQLLGHLQNLHQQGVQQRLEHSKITLGHQSDVNSQKLGHMASVDAHRLMHAGSVGDQQYLLAQKMSNLNVGQWQARDQIAERAHQRKGEMLIGQAKLEYLRTGGWSHGHGPGQKLIM